MVRFSRDFGRAVVTRITKRFTRKDKTGNEGLEIGTILQVI